MDRTLQRVAATMLAATFLCANQASAAEKIDPQPGKPLPRVLLIGDSICGGYHKVVQRELEGKAVVVVIDGNAEYTGAGVKKLDHWLGDGRWDVIHFNWGLWDMYGWQYAKEDHSPAAYEKRLEIIVARLKKTGARLLWATTTPACPEAERTMRTRFKTELKITPQVEQEYLDAALRVMKKHDVQIDDLHALMLPEMKKYAAAPDNVHFSGAGYGMLGKQVARAILRQLGDSTAGKPLPRVLLIGDSICIGYANGVKKLLAGKAEVVKNEGNAERTGTGLKKIDQWLGDGHWDVIHFNWGLWDVAHRNPTAKDPGHLDKVNGKLTTTLTDYEKNLQSLVARMKKTGAKLIWASITPIPDNALGRIKGDEIKYNAVAAKIMAENGIAIDDLHAEVLRLGRPKTNDVHDTGDLAPKVAGSIMAELAKRNQAAVPSPQNSDARGGFVWPSAIPADCPFERSPVLTGVFFTGRPSNYHCGDTWYPSWARHPNVTFLFCSDTDVSYYVPASPCVTSYSPAVIGSPVVVPYRTYYGVPGRSIYGTPQVYVPGEPVRNVLRSITP